MPEEIVIIKDDSDVDDDNFFSKKAKLESDEDSARDLSLKVSPCRKTQSQAKKTELADAVENMQKSHETMMREISETYKKQAENSESRLLSFLWEQNEKNRQMLLEMTKILSEAQHSSQMPAFANTKMPPWLILPNYIYSTAPPATHVQATCSHSELNVPASSSVAGAAFTSTSLDPEDQSI